MLSIKEFDEFQKHFLEYQRLFGLTGYKVYFRQKALDGCFASISVEQEDRVATVTLNTKPIKFKYAPQVSIRENAKHEALHLFLWRLEDKATARYISRGEIYEEVENLVRKLEDLVTT